MNWQVEDFDSLDLVQTQVSGKPVILFYSPVPIQQATAKLALSPAWSFTGVYPYIVSTPHSTGLDSVTWSFGVDSLQKGGMLTMKDSGLRVSSLFWEAESTHISHSMQAVLAFDPRTPSVTPENSVLLAFESLIPYLEKVLRDLTLTNTAATDFMQYWIPSFTAISERGHRIAIRFLPQGELEAAAPLEINPVPDVTTRVFMLFTGVDDPRTVEWSAGPAAANDINWNDIVGVQADASDPSKYRVLEWGGSESTSAQEQAFPALTTSLFDGASVEVHNT